MKQLVIQVSTNPEYWGPIAITIAAVFCLALIIFTFASIAADMELKKVKKQPNTNHYALAYTTSHTQVVHRKANRFHSQKPISKLARVRK